jgi:glycosyltransferase involved in cell wall biosynthesis
MSHIPAQITTVIPTFRRPQKVERAVRSVLAQSYPNFEIHVYDNASGDATQDVVSAVAATDSRVKYFCRPENIGFVKNFSTGMKSARTAFVNLLSDDDLLLPNFFADAMSAFGRHPEAFLFAGLVSERDSDGAPYAPARNLVKPGVYHAPFGFTALMQESVPRLWTSMMFRREVFDQVGVLDETLITQHDHEFVIRVALRWPVVFENTMCGVFFHNRDSIHTSTPRREVLLGWSQIFRKLDRDLSLPTDVRKQAVRCVGRYLRRDLIRRGLLSAVKGQPQEVATVAAFLESEADCKWSGRVMSLLALPGPVGSSLRLAVRLVLIAKRKLNGVRNYLRPLRLSST